MTDSKDNWAGIIRAVKSPIGFFALVVLCIEAVLALVVFQVDKSAASNVIYVMAGVLVLVVGSVLVIAIRDSTNTPRPQNVDLPAPKSEKQTALSHPSDYEILQRKIVEYADQHRSTRLVFAKGDRIIKKGDVSKCRVVSDESKIYLTIDMIDLVDRSRWKLAGPVMRELDKLETKPQLYLLEGSVDR